MCPSRRASFNSRLPRARRSSSPDRLAASGRVSGPSVFAGSKILLFCRALTDDSSRSTLIGRTVRNQVTTSLPPVAPGHSPSSVPSLAPLIDVRGLGRSYGALVAVKDISFSVGRGEIVGFLGPNGAGKSTTLRMIVGYLGPSTGSVRVNGFDVVEQPLLARQAMGYMPETAPLYPEMRVREYLMFRARLKHITKSEQPRSVDQAVHKAGIGEVVRTLIGTLSRGFRQRVALADALLGDPPLLILDEPTAGLDPNQIH